MWIEFRYGRSVKFFLIEDKEYYLLVIGDMVYNTQRIGYDEAKALPMNAFLVSIGGSLPYPVKHIRQRCENEGWGTKERISVTSYGNTILCFSESKTPPPTRDRIYVNR